ncbi:tRNA pseudouridine(13) synthase TruD [Thiomicrorhabdus sp. ZW0627]|uniref:tRNA pseudouridine(13) synthase TruD n=1 Tax=Thiomicrorhabdus sp. ZW0627 TaxID=3039774 RepID=UPI00243725E8|nr:tRNA pseudouridine(13) synthase TruD [Thiomicrorhabdus sp. ZW0627]MDG6774460.1 tRNA pseudouridine(13) synthase TruD [Thiomicrorhabdus sp. ZW0627]
MYDFPQPLMDSLAYAYGKPFCSAVYKVSPEDFVVEEQIAYELSGEGEHLWCWVEKRGENTDWVLQQLAKWAGVSPARIGVAGQKDRHAVTRQWFSIQLPGQADPNPEDLGLENVKILKMVRHQRKLQTGGLSGNRFELVLRQLQAQPDELQTRLLQIQQFGVPNYFGEQRFGFKGNNLCKATDFLQGKMKRVKRNQKSLYISAARSWLFNLVLSERVSQENWNRFKVGDVLQLEGSSRWFVEDGSEDLAERVESGDLHPTGPLVGRGELPSQESVRTLEESIVQPYDIWLQGLEQLGLKQDRRSLRVLPKDFEWQWLKGGSGEEAVAALKVSFSLPAGSYATMVLREICQIQDAQIAKKMEQHSGV